MKAWAITEPGKTALIDKEKPTPTADEVLVKIHTVGYCGTDLNTFRGANPLVKYPRVPGHELAGAIEARGQNVPAEWSLNLEVTLSPYTSCGKCSSCRQKRFNCCRFNETL